MIAKVTAPTSQSVRAALDTHQKALAVNLDPASFGTFAEIGAGQEVARWFLRVGAASGTVAKTVCAYDKEVSDDLYGAGTRYVSKPRVEAMLEGEWKSLLHQVGKQRGDTSRFFAFADTIAARNFAGTNDCHGWVGLRFLDKPKAEPSDILLHVNLRDSANLLQQEAVGILGVNLVHAFLHERVNLAEVPARFFDSLTVDRIEIDQIEVRGHVFNGCDLRAMHLAQARDGRAEMVTFDAGGSAIAANEFFYKKAVVIAPAASDPREELSPEAIAACVKKLRSDVAGDADVKDVIAARLVVVEPEAPLPVLNQSAAMVTRHPALYRATAFVRRYTQAPLRFAMPLPALMRIFDEARYKHLAGRLLEGISRLFGSDVRVLAYPCRREEFRTLLGAESGRGWEIDDSKPWITADQVRPAPPLKYFYEYLLASGFLVVMPP